MAFITSATSVAKEDDIIMLVVLGMFVIVLIMAFISDLLSPYASNKTNEEFRIKKNGSSNLAYPSYRRCNSCELFDDEDEYEQYQYQNPYAYRPTDGWLASRGLLPWWNATRFTRNTSYDIRGDITPFGACTGLCGCDGTLC